MFHSKSFGRIFWVDERDDFRSCPERVDGTGDFDNSDYVSEWNDFEGVNFETKQKMKEDPICKQKM